MNETKIYVTKDGVLEEYDLLITFRNTKTNKDYAVYTDNMLDEEGKTITYATVYEKDENGRYVGVEEPSTQEEWDEIISVLKRANNLD